MSRRGRTGTAMAATRERRGCWEPRGVGPVGRGIEASAVTVRQSGGCRLGLRRKREERKGEFW